MPDDVFHQYFHHVNLPQWTVGGQAGLLGPTVMSGISILKRKLHLKFQPTSSGKTQLIKRFLESRGSICSYPRNHTIIFYSHWQDAYVEMKNKSLVDEFVQGM